MIVVPGSGPIPASWMLVGEAPGEVEARYGRPFAGPSGREQEAWLQRYGTSARHAYLTNVVKEYRHGNPDPTPEQIEFWTPILVEEIRAVQPKLIVAVGRFAMRWLLGDAAELSVSRGIAHRPGAFDPAIADRANGAIVIPVTHPVAGLHDLASRVQVAADYRRAAEAIRLVNAGRPDLIQIRRDEYAGRERYVDATGAELAKAIGAAPHPIRRVGFDTEGSISQPWSLQISWEPGTAYVLRTAQPDFAVGVAAIQRLVDAGCTFIKHDASTPSGGIGWDTQVARACGLELRDAAIGDTMYAAFLLRTEPRGLKALAWRWCGMEMTDYEALMGGIGREKQIDYIEQVTAATDWARLEPHVVRENDGSFKVKKYQPVERRAKAILNDIAKDKRNKDGEPVDVKQRWSMVEPEQRAIVEERFGPFPEGTLNDVDLDQAVFYATRDADATLRLDDALSTEMRKMEVQGLYATGMQVLPIFEEMQQVGMPASRKSFVDLAATVQAEMYKIQSGLSHRYFGGKPFNPGTGTKHVEQLVLSLGVKGLKKSKKTERVSTSMKSIEHLAKDHPAIAEIREYRQRQKVLTTYCLPLIQIADEQFALEQRPLDGESDIFLVRCKLKPFLETRRLAAEDPSLLNQPSRTELGRKVRACYMTGYWDADDPNAEVFGSWDFSSQEVRVAAHVSADKLLCSIVSDTSRDIHFETASRIFGKPIDQIKKNEERTPAKTAFFGILYGLSGMGLMDQFRTFGLEDWSQDDCDKLIAEIFKVYPGLLGAINAARAEARKTGMVRDLYGHIRYLPAIYSDKRNEESEAGRQAFSHKIQGTAQGMTQNAMASLRPKIRQLQREGLPVRWCLQIHDELILRMPRWLFPVVNDIMVEGMTRGYGLKMRVPVLADGHMSVRWDQLK